jgi:glycosyltransferase involved in cell wall biosynthesis
LARSCLVISAFLPRADDAGHRKRTFESCQLLRDFGYELTLLHLTFEGDWYWRRQAVDHAALLSCGITQYLEYHIEQVVGMRPKDSTGLHQVDEWFSDELLSYLCNHFKHTFYDVVIVHNVWLSKVFDLLDMKTVCVIETHDVFSSRVEQFKRIDSQPDFFTCSEQDEIFGLNRANIVIAIKEADAEWMRNFGVTAEVVTVAPRPEPKLVKDKVDYLHPDKVTFGFVGSSHPFNVHGLNSFLSILRHKLLLNPVAVEVKIAGNVCDKIVMDTFPFAQKLGFIPSLTDFYESVDFVFTPLDFGSGLKLKVAESIDFGVPVIATEHSAAGVSLDKSLVVNNATQVADRLVEIAGARQPYGQFLAQIVESRKAGEEAYAQSKAILEKALAKSSKSFLINYPELLLDRGHPFFSVTAALLRLLSGQGRVWVLAFRPEIEVLKRVIARMPASVELFLMKQPAQPSQFIDLVEMDAQDKSVMSTSIFLTSKKNNRVPLARAEFYDNFMEFSEHQPEVSILERLTNLRTNDTFPLPFYNESTRWEPTLTRPCIPNFSRTTLILKLSDSHEQTLNSYIECFYPAYELLVFKDDQALTKLVLKWLRDDMFGGYLFIQAEASKLVIILCQYMKIFGYQIHLFTKLPVTHNGLNHQHTDNVLVEHNLESKALYKLTEVDS